MEKQEHDILSYLINYYEINSHRQNGKIFLSVIDKVSQKIGKSISFNFDNIDILEYECDIAKGYTLVQKLVYDENFQEYLLALLQSKHYYMKSFIKDLIKELGNAKVKTEAEGIMDRYLRLPFINDIQFNGMDTYIIQSAYGDYSFLLADRVIDDEDILEYMHAKSRKRDCHTNATTLLNHYDDLYSICSLCHHYFIDSYYHSYEYFKERDAVLDLCSNMFIKKSAFDDLYSPREIIFMQNESLRKMYFSKVKGIRSAVNVDGVLKCALYRQSLMLDNDPEEKRKVLEFNGITNLQ